VSTALSGFSRRLIIVTAAALALGGCVTTPPGDAPASSAPATTGGTNFASPEPLLQRYPDMGRGP
jgi:hypothetical protein